MELILVKSKKLVQAHKKKISYYGIMAYYAVAKGRQVGIFREWKECERQVKGFNGARYKKFETMKDAEAFMKDKEMLRMKPQSLLNFVSRETPTEGDHCLIVFTDGACHANGAHYAKASYAVVWPEHQSMNAACLLDGVHQTNNRGEMMALIHAIQQAVILDPRYEKTLIVYSDSMLLIKTVSEWLGLWKRKGWVKADGGPVANIDLVKMLDDLLQTRKVSMRHVRAHTGSRDWESTFNDQVDKLAKSVLV